MQFETFDWIAHNARRRPEKTALVDLASGRRIDYAQMHRRVGNLAGFLRDRFAIAPGDRVALLAENSSDCLEVQFACFRIGAVFVPLNWRLVVPELTYIVGDAAPKAMIHDRGLAETAVAVQAKTGVPHRLETAADGSPSDFETAIAEGPFEAEMVRQDMSDLSVVMYTSGTTGLPKGARITHGMNFINTVNIGIPHRVTADSVTLTVLPLFHTGGLNVYANPVLHAGGTVLVARRFDPEECLSLLADPAAGITNFLGVPANYQFMAQLPAFEMANFNHVAVLGVGAAPTPNALIELWAAKGAPLAQAYGMTETAPAVLLLDPVDATRKVGSAGKPLLYTRTRVMTEDGREAVPGERGELQVAGPNVTPGYWNKPVETAESFDGQWLKTGDAVWVDNEGYYYIVDRWKDMYISGGENVYPAEVENVLYRLDGIAEAAVVGIADERWGEVGCAVIVCREDTALEPQQVLDHCASQLARFKQPRRILFTDALPRNATGKVLKHELRRMLAAGELDV
ncbi:MAG: long-chain fatty acid--CoA ligase [Alphaproteobacteria bacterium]|nr:long-chain fatty acid--CoA ligase [Alphaproteobacteria bacterium]MCY4319243.1 long-chain fatty acid--CoA ligase [Alphaproteobacteria bacterium]